MVFFNAKDDKTTLTTDGIPKPDQRGNLESYY
jgi:hypothetical protein